MFILLKKTVIIVPSTLKIIISATPTKQQQLELPIIPIDKCKRLYSDSLPVTDDQLCVGGEANVDACAGFGGAPLILLDHTTHSQYYQASHVH